MRIEELMVGDWVNIADKPVKLTKSDFGVMCCFNEDKVFHLSPIPLTDENLNKNFSQDTANHQWFIGSADIKCRISIVKDKFGWMEGCKGVYFIELRYNHTGIVKQITFVHELQHAFRLCGFEKEIKL